MVVFGIVPSASGSAARRAARRNERRRVAHVGLVAAPLFQSGIGCPVVTGRDEVVVDLARRRHRRARGARTPWRLPRAARARSGSTSCVARGATTRRCADASRVLRVVDR
eukprot:31314-Pelagococcus_subviridis.AAC.26